MMYDSSLYVEKSAWDPSVYVNTPAVFGAKSYVVRATCSDSIGEPCIRFRIESDS